MQLKRDSRMLLVAPGLLIGTASGRAQPALSLARHVVVPTDDLHVGNIWRGTVSPEGIIYLVINGEKAVAVFGADGKRVGTMGRPGQGPGDFRAIRSLGFVGDTVWFSDPVLQRVTLYASDRTLIGTRRVEKLSYPPGFPFKLPKTNSLYPRGLLSDGRMMIQADVYSLYVSPTSGAFPGIPLVVTSKDGKVDHLVGWIPVTPDVAGPPNNPSHWVQPAFANVPAHAVSADGNRFASVVASLADTLTWARVAQTNAAGDTVYSRTIPIYAPEIPAEERERVMNSLGRDRRKGAAEMRSRAPRHYPPLKAAFLANDGALLIAFNSAKEQSYSARAVKSGQRQYLVLEPDGRPRGRLELAASTSVLHFDGANIWAAELDEDGAQSVVRYRLGMPPG